MDEKIADNFCSTKRSARFIFDTRRAKKQVLRFYENAERSQVAGTRKGRREMKRLRTLILSFSHLPSLATHS